MLFWGANARSLFLTSFFALVYHTALPPAQAAASPQQHGLREPTVQISSAGRYSVRGAAFSRAKQRGGAYAHGGGVSCVPFARNDSGISVTGNAWQWWDNAVGVYARGSVPEAGSILTFRSNGRMRLGHVAVVSRVINPREIQIDHANWWGGMVARNIPVVDVSEANDWTAVRVGLSRSGEFGSVYPTYGFIYDRPDTGKMVASSRAPAPQADLNPPPSDLRPVTERGWQAYEEVAEAPAAPRNRKQPAHAGAPHSRQIMSFDDRR